MTAAVPGAAAEEFVHEESLPVPEPEVASEASPDAVPEPEVAPEAASDGVPEPSADQAPASDSGQAAPAADAEAATPEHRDSDRSAGNPV